ncbi:MAG: purine-nucleoside phosphorylase [Clostridiales bacterium]|nr:purine-nucleoside phosphorylase [Clostridiales bacterium]
MKTKEQVIQAAEKIRHISSNISFDAAVILGSGLGEYGNTLSEIKEISYSNIPFMPCSTVDGHKGSVLVGKKGSKNLLIFQGRVHFYEGRSLNEVIFSVRLMHELGIKKLILTNAAGAVNESFLPGELMLICDHINLSGHNCLVGTEALDFGERFPSMCNVYSENLRHAAIAAAREKNICLREGIYFYCTGPSYETPSEVRAIRLLGGDAVGMSTVHEATAAVQMGMEVLGISCLTNMAAGISKQALTHSEVLETGKRTQRNFMTLIDKIIENI